MGRAAEVVEEWQDHWSEALGLWSRFTRLRPPTLCTTSAAARREGLTGSFAMIRLADQSVVIDLQQIVALGLADRPLEVLGHEIGHHIAAPASVTTSARVIARMRVALPGVEHTAPMLANLYADLLINDRLQRDRGLAVHELYRAIAAASTSRPSPLWRMYLRTYEILWALQGGTLTDAEPGTPLDARVEGDAQLCARLVRSYASQWASGAGRFAALCFGYLEADGDDALDPAGVWGDATAAGAGARIPPGLAEPDPEEEAGAIHPALDPALNGLGRTAADPDDGTGPPRDDTSSTSSAGQHREPFEYGEILRALGMDLTGHEVAVRYYRELAQRHLVPFPSRPDPTPGETLPEGFEPWTPGEALADIDWLQTVLTSPTVIPGVTTVQRVHGVDDMAPPVPVPVDLDIYIDSSGSMPNPQQRLSYPALAGTVLVLSALRAGARVQATLWSGAQQFQTTDGFTEDRDAILRVVLGHIGGGTAFPLHVLRETYRQRRDVDRPAHILVVSDDGVTTIFNDDEEGTPGREVQAEALRRARGGGTWVLELFGTPSGIEEARDMGWTIEEVDDLEGLVAFARRFARATYTGTAA